MINIFSFRKFLERAYLPLLYVVFNEKKKEKKILTEYPYLILLTHAVGGRRIPYVQHEQLEITFFFPQILCCVSGEIYLFGYKQKISPA